MDTIQLATSIAALVTDRINIFRNYYLIGLNKVKQWERYHSMLFYIRQIYLALGTPSSIEIQEMCARAGRKGPSKYQV